MKITCACLNYSVLVCDSLMPAMTTDGAVKRKGLCVLRPYKRADNMAVLELIEQATMETVSEFFWAAVFSEIFPQVRHVFMSSINCR